MKQRRIYLHILNYPTNGTPQVQYCKESKAGVYGSYRNNSEEVAHILNKFPR